ncbi:MAG: hypothetical protein EA425_15225 [Puniceicoccaceae bacterium]|nr:MAG: hypothetical protein EA425_15225 [Puniceicoccaceae bacterium]
MMDEVSSTSSNIYEAYKETEDRLLKKYEDQITDLDDKQLSKLIRESNDRIVRERLFQNLILRKAISRENIMQRKKSLHEVFSNSPTQLQNFIAVIYADEINFDAFDRDLLFSISRSMYSQRSILPFIMFPRYEKELSYDDISDGNFKLSFNEAQKLKSSLSYAFERIYMKRILNRRIIDYVNIDFSKTYVYDATDLSRLLQEVEVEENRIKEKR